MRSIVLCWYPGKFQHRGTGVKEEHRVFYSAAILYAHLPLRFNTEGKSKGGTHWELLEGVTLTRHCEERSSLCQVLPGRDSFGFILNTRLPRNDGAT